MSRSITVYLFLTIITVFLSSSILATRIAFGSCSSQKEGKGALWNELAAKDPNYLILLGDNIYTDVKGKFGHFTGATPERIRSQYEIFQDDSDWNLVLNKLGGWDRIFATWDDHDYGINNGDNTFPYRNESLEHFLQFFHVSEEDMDSLRRRGGVYSSKDIFIPNRNNDTFKVKIVMLDTRYFKDPKHTAHGDFLGEAQWKWFEEQMQDHSAHLIIVGSSIQALPTQKIVEESWSDFPESRSRLLDVIGSSPCSNVVLLSGDVHMAEVSQATCLSGGTGRQRRLWEFTSSGLSHTFISYLSSNNGEKMIVSRGNLINSLFNMYQATYPAPYRENRFKDQYKGVHFGMINVQLETATPHIAVDIYNHEGLSVIHKAVPLLDELPISTDESYKHLGNHTKCTPVNGEEESYKKVLFLFCNALYLFVVIFVPCLFALWLVFASGFYILFEREMKRRERIEANYQKALEEKAKKSD